MGYRREEIITIICDNSSCGNEEKCMIDTNIDNATLKESNFLNKLIAEGWTGIKGYSECLCPKCSDD